jgi:preprotein translocase subunit YajC
MKMRLLPGFQSMNYRLIILTFFVTQTSWSQSASGADGSGLTQLLPMLLIFFGIFYFIVIRPQQKEQRQHQERISNLQKGDRVITSGGIHGTVRATKDKTLVLEIADGVKVTLNRQAVSAVLEGTPGKGKQTEEDEEEEG